MLERVLRQANLRLAWQMRFPDFLDDRLTLAQHARLQAECFQVFGPGSGEDVSKEEPWH